MKRCPLMLLAAAGVLLGCSQPPQKPPAATAPQPSTVSDPTAKTKDSGPSKIGTVGLIREMKERGMSTKNWAGVIGSVFNNDTEKDVIAVRYEVTIFYRDGTQGIVMLDQPPTVQTGQRVRVTGDTIESLER